MVFESPIGHTYINPHVHLHIYNGFIYRFYNRTIMDVYLTSKYHSRENVNTQLSVVLLVLNPNTFVIRRGKHLSSSL